MPPSLDLRPRSRKPCRLVEATLRVALDLPVPDRWRGVPAGFGGPVASIILVTYNGLAFTKLCVHSLFANTDADAEVVVVDNASTDGTRGFLEKLSARHPRVRVIFNEANRGFAPANNQALAVAAGPLLVLLNNDTIVPQGWLGRLASHTRDCDVGAVGPVTNRIGNEAEVPSPYRTLGEMERFAAERAERHAGEAFDIPMLAMFCLAMRRDVFERVGPLDERFEVGMFEDDDYAMRLRARGYRVRCAEDSFVHHFGQASFGELSESGEQGQLFAANRARFEEKWDVRWETHALRPTADYGDFVSRFELVLRDALPRGARPLLVSKGDEKLIEIAGAHARHFPADESGLYWGRHAASSDEAIAQLEAERARGATHLIFPASTAWWLDHYAGLREHLESRYASIISVSNTCVIFDVTRSRPEAVTDP